MIAVPSCSDQSKVEIVNHFMYALITTLHQYYIVVVYLSSRYVLNKLTIIKNYSLRYSLQAGTWFKITSTNNLVNKIFVTKVISLEISFEYEYKVVAFVICIIFY